MRLLPKLALGILAASALPLAVTGLSAARLSENTLRRRIEADHATLAANAADGATRFLEGILDSLAVYPQLVDGLETASTEVTTGVLRVAYRAGDSLAIVTLLRPDGAPVIPPVYLHDPAAARALGDRPVVTPPDVASFLARVPHAEALAQGRALGKIALERDGDARCAAAVAFGPPSDRRVLAADVSLRRLGVDLQRLSVGGTEVLLVDEQRRVVAGGATGRALLSTATLPDDRAAGGPLPARSSVARVHPPGGPPLLAAFAPAPAAGLHFGVLVTQPEAIAFAVSRGLRNRTWYWLAVSVAVALAVGFGLAQGVSRRVRNLADGTARLAHGDFGVRLSVGERDELGELAAAFNHTAEELGHAAAAIRAQHEEIQHKNADIIAKNQEILGWNRELERRVEEKSRELQRAQDLLLRSQSMAAVGTLGAGMAHEINNPLTGILGAAQLLLLDLDEKHPSRSLVGDIEQQAQRIRIIVANLLRMSQHESGEEQAAIDLNRVIDDALATMDAQDLGRRSIVVERHLASELPAVRGNRQRLQEAIAELLGNARKAMAQGGRLIVTTSAPDPRIVSLAVKDTGHGIAPEHLSKIFDPFFTTKADWSSTGLGLAMVHKVVEDHKGSIVVDSEVGRGSTFTVSFPSAAAAASHLGA